MPVGKKPSTFKNFDDQPLQSVSNMMMQQNMIQVNPAMDQPIIKKTQKKNEKMTRRGDDQKNLQKH